MQASGQTGPMLPGNGAFLLERPQIHKKVAAKAPLDHTASKITSVPAPAFAGIRGRFGRRAAALLGFALPQIVTQSRSQALLAPFGCPLGPGDSGVGFLAFRRHGARLPPDCGKVKAVRRALGPCRQAEKRP